MSLYPTALTAIRTNLELAANKQKPPHHPHRCFKRRPAR
jgi:hypothetical protein